MVGSGGVVILGEITNGELKKKLFVFIRWRFFDGETWQKKQSRLGKGT